MLRASLAIRDRPEADDWKTFYAKSLLSGRRSARRSTPMSNRCYEPLSRE
jgi:hypothetical protein